MCSSDLNMGGDGILLVPFESLGIEQFAGRNTKSYNYHATVLIHEMAHQATSDVLMLMPKWVAEGLAEYAGSMIYRNGVFYLGARERLQALHQRLDAYDKLTREEEARVLASPSTRPATAGTISTTRLPESWIMRVESLGHGVTTDDVLLRSERADEFLLMGLRLAEGIDPKRFEQLSGRPLDAKRIAILREEGAVEITAGGMLRVTPTGFPVLDAVVADLAA